MSATGGQFVVMGVSGCGKSTVAEMLAQETGGSFLDADDFHPPANREKMAAGIPLCDEDRWGWLEILNRELKTRDGSGKPLFLACSALRQVYRDRLSEGCPHLRFIYLKGSAELIRSRMASRENHFMPTSLLDSQFATLEEPQDAMIADIGLSLPLLIKSIRQQIV